MTDLHHSGERPVAFPWLLVLLGWLLVAIVICIKAAVDAPTAPLIADTDDAMRLVVVRDLLAGQSWYDHVQYRLNTPFGAEIHWSRLIDVPIAALLLLLGPLAGPATDVVVAWVWPLLLSLGLMIVSAKTAFVLVGRPGIFPAIVLPALSLALLAEFEPGRLDHHSVQIILAIGLLWCSLEALRRDGFAIWAGIMAATSLAIGTEGLPTVLAGILAFGFIWVFKPERNRALAGFGLGIACAGLVHLVIAHPPERWLVPACDAYSFVYFALCIGVGAAFGLLAVLPLAHRPALVRLAAGSLACALLVALLVALFPQCLGGPYAAVDPWLVRNWINYIAEAKPIWQSFASIPAYVISVALPPIIALAVIAIRVKDGDEKRAEWLIYALFLLVVVAVMMLQIRGARFVSAFAVPAGAWLIISMRGHYLRAHKLLPLLGLLLSWLGFAGIAVGTGVNAVINAVPAARQMVTGTAARPSKLPCLMPESFLELAALPRQRLMTPIDLGAHMLLYTPHSVLAAPYHRNQQGVRATFDFVNRPIAEGRQILIERQIDMVVICPGMPEMRGFGDAAEDSFVRLWEAGRLPGWLEEQSLPDSPFDVYRVIRP